MTDITVIVFPVTGNPYGAIIPFRGHREKIKNLLSQDCEEMIITPLDDLILYSRVQAFPRKNTTITPVINGPIMGTVAVAGAKYAGRLTPADAPMDVERIAKDAHQFRKNPAGRGDFLEAVSNCVTTPWEYTNFPKAKWLLRQGAGLGIHKPGWRAAVYRAMVMLDQDKDDWSLLGQLQAGIIQMNFEKK